MEGGVWMGWNEVADMLDYIDSRGRRLLSFFKCWVMLYVCYFFNDDWIETIRIVGIIWEGAFYMVDSI